MAAKIQEEEKERKKNLARLHDPVTGRAGPDASHEPPSLMSSLNAVTDFGSTDSDDDIWEAFSNEEASIGDSLSSQHCNGHYGFGLARPTFVDVDYEAHFKALTGDLDVDLARRPNSDGVQSQDRARETADCITALDTLQ